MSRSKKEAVLSDLEKKYIEEVMKNVRPADFGRVFERLSGDINKPIELVSEYVNSKGYAVVDEQLPPEPTPRKLKPHQENARNLLTPNRLTESNKARHVTVMTDSASQAMEEIPPSPIKGSSKYKNCIFRQ